MPSKTSRQMPDAGIGVALTGAIGSVRRCCVERRWIMDTTETPVAVAMTKLTTQARKKLRKLAFALPGGRYPVEDKVHARDAKARAAQQRNAGFVANQFRLVLASLPRLRSERATAQPCPPSPKPSRQTAADHCAVRLRH